MSIELSAQDVLAIGRQLERRGVKFYQLAAVKAPDEPLKQLFLELAQMEQQHEQVFIGLGSDGASLEPALDKASSSWQIVASTFLSGLDQDLFDRFTGKLDRADVLREAMAFEKDTITLFLTLKSMLPNSDDKLKVDQMLREELGHLLQLGSELAKTDRRPWASSSLFGESGVTGPD